MSLYHPGLRYHPNLLRASSTFFIVSPGENTVLFCELFKSRYSHPPLFARSSMTVTSGLCFPPGTEAHCPSRTTITIFDHIPQADCLLPQESFGIENDVLGDDDTNILHFSTILFVIPQVSPFPFSIEIGQDSLKISTYTKH